MKKNTDEGPLLRVPIALHGSVQIHASIRGQEVPEAVAELLGLGLKVARARDRYALQACRGERLNQQRGA